MLILVIEVIFPNAVLGLPNLKQDFSGNKYETLSLEIIDLVLGYYGKLPGDLNKNLLLKASENKKEITSRPADLIDETFDNFRDDLRSFCKKLEIKDLSNIDEQVLTFILIPYGCEKVFNNLNS